MRPAALALVLVVSGISSCSPAPEAPSTFVVKGTVSTGAHKRTPFSGGHLYLLKPPDVRYAAWAGALAAPVTMGTIHADGTYRFTIERYARDFGRTSPIVIAASDDPATLTMIAEIPGDLAVVGAELTIDINPSTTLAAQMICPGGHAPPPANTWCYSDPAAASVRKTELVGIIDGALGGTLIAIETGSPPNWEKFASGFLNDAATFRALMDHLTRQGVELGSATPASIAASIGAATLPLVRTPSAASSSSSGSSSGGGKCELVWDCGTSKQCASVYGAPTGRAPQPNATTCASTCKAQGACTCQGC